MVNMELSPNLILFLLGFFFKRSKKNIEDIKGVFKNLKSRKDRQYNGKRKKVKRTSNDLQKTKQTRSPIRYYFRNFCNGVNDYIIFILK